MEMKWQKKQRKVKMNRNLRENERDGFGKLARKQERNEKNVPANPCFGMEMASNIFKLGDKEQETAYEMTCAVSPSLAFHFRNKLIGTY